MIITGGTRPLRIISLTGLVSAFFGLILAAAVVFRRFAYGYPAGFASVFVILLILSGLTLVAIGVLAEYVGAVSRVSQGRPLYATWSDPANGPLRRDDSR
jgi:undecaprenyl-phosphate 4-deoxy-4-formamido-L-arabinose transferase